MHVAEAAVDERMPCLRLIVRLLGEAEIPDGVLVPRVCPEECVLISCARLNVLPARAEHVLARVDQTLRVPDRLLVHRVCGHSRIPADPQLTDYQVASDTA